MTEQDLLLRNLQDPSRVCPMFAGTAHIHGSNLKIRLNDEMIKISAPPRFLSLLFDLCQGDRTIDELARVSEEVFGDTRFMAFVQDLLGAGVLIDAAGCLPHLSLSLAQAGKRAADPVWQSLLPQRTGTREESKEAIRLSSGASGKLSMLLEKRESATAFGQESLSEEVLQQMLFSAYGLCASGHRTVPSAGGFYRLSLYLILLRPAGRIAAGVYRIQADEAGTTLLYPVHGDLNDVPRLLVDPAAMRNATGIVVVSADFRPGSLKYRNKAYPYMLLEAGAVVQNMGLMAADQGVGWRTLGIESEQRLARFLRVDEGESHAVVSGVLGSLPEGDLHTAMSAAISASAQTDLAVEFGWADATKDLPFHMGMARIKTASDELAAHYSWGRDINAQIAYDKALAEATERYAYCQLRECTPAHFGDFPHMLAPHTLVSYREQQYDKSNFPFVRFDPEKLYLWSKATWLTTGQQCWVPAECVYARSAIPLPYAEHLLTSVTSSGCASGGTLEHAQASALFEVIERDAFMRHWFAQRGGEDVDTQTIPRRLSQRIAALVARGCSVKLQLLDLGVFPVWFFFVQHADRHFTVVSAGAGLNAEQSLESALCEAETAAYVRLSKAPVRRIFPSTVTTAIDHADLYAQKRYFRRADALTQSTGLGAYDQLIDRFPRSLEQALAHLEARGLAPLWVDLSLNNAPRTLDGRALISGRVLVSGLIPLAFGADRMPYGMDTYRLRTARFPHPFS